jgi:parvulin-like peptidyl-prolyl isomerase
MNRPVELARQLTGYQVPRQAHMKKLLLPIFLLATQFSHAQVDPSRVVFTVNGEEVKGGEYYRRMEYLPGVGRASGSGFAEYPPGFLTIEQLITERFLLQLAKEKGVLPTDAEVQQELTNAIEDSPKLLEDWQNAGRTRPELEYEMRYQLAQFKLITRGITITDQQVEQFYNSNPTMYTLPKRVKLRVIVVDSVTAKEAVDADLKSGKTFAQVAGTRSLDLSKAIGGDYGITPIGQLSAQAQDAVTKKKADGTTDWLESDGNYIKFLVEQVLPEEKQPLDAKLKRRIRKQRMLDNGRVKNDLQKEMSAMRAKSKIDIKQKEFAEAYNRFIKAFGSG